MCINPYLTILSHFFAFLALGVRIYGWTDHWTDRQINRQTDKTSYGDPWMHLKIHFWYFSKHFLIYFLLYNCLTKNCCNEKLAYFTMQLKTTINKIHSPLECRFLKKAIDKLLIKCKQLKNLGWHFVSGLLNIWHILTVL